MSWRWPALLVLFAASGVPALVYQIVWQRSLFTVFGTDSVSVTIVVSAFMLGLGAGSLAGGEISRHPRAPLLPIFAVLEIGTGLFALVSLAVFDRVGGSAALSPLGLFAVSFLVLLVPTAMMGMTLPLLTAFLVRHSGMVGRSVGLLYAANTLGSALACFAATYWLMPYLGKQQSLQVAAAVNFGVGLLVLLFHRQERSRPAAAARKAQPAAARAKEPDAPVLPIWLGVLAAAAAGFLSLGFEVAWYRLYSFASGGRAETFPMLLGYFLIGTAVGAAVVAWGTGPGGFLLTAPRRKLAWLMLGASAAGLLVAPLLALLAPHVAGILRQGMLAILPAALFGMVLPLVSEWSIAPDDRAGRRLSFVYAANIVGSTLGALVVGALLMDVLSLGWLLVVLLGIGLAAGWMLRGRVPAREAVPALGVAAALLLVAGPILFGDLYERLQPRGPEWRGIGRFEKVVETRSGVITVDSNGVVYGGGIYDGRLDTNLLSDRGRLVRPFALGAVHAAPRRVLMIGLAGGAWAQVIAHNPLVERLVVVEINPGYREVIRHRSAVESLLRNPKVEIVTGDGRQWLKTHPAETFDAIVMNTTFSWRNNASNVLSQEFLRLVASRLAPDGVALVNPTGSGEVVATALSVFPYALDFGGTLFLGNRPLSFDRVRWRDLLERYRLDGRPVFDLSDAAQKARLEEIVTGTPVRDTEATRQRGEGKRPITDDNMGVEWPRRLF